MKKTSEINEITDGLKNLSFQNDIVFSDGSRIGLFTYLEKDYINLESEPKINYSDNENNLNYKVDLINNRVDQINLLQSYNSDLVKRFHSNESNLDIKTIGILNWMVLNNSDSNRERCCVKGYDIDFVCRRRNMSKFLSMPYDKHGTEVFVTKFHNSFFIYDSISQSGSSNVRKSYAGLMLNHFLFNKNGLVENFQNVNSDSIANEIQCVSMKYCQIGPQNEDKYNVLLAVNNDCLLDKDNTEVFCEVKSKDLPRNFNPNPTVKNWWNGANDRPNKIQYLKLSDLLNQSDQDYVLKILIGEYHLKKYWEQCFVNSSKVVLVGLYDIIGNIKISNKFLLNTVIEIKIEHIERFLTKNTKFNIQKCYEFVYDLLTKIKNKCIDENATYRVRMCNYGEFFNCRKIKDDNEFLSNNFMESFKN